jgi:hypothetical protein
MIAHNTWRNIEGGLFARENYLDRYQAAAEGPEEHEALSRERVFEYLWQAPKLSLLARQGDAFVRRISSSYIHRGTREGRWGEAGSSMVLVALADAGTLISWLVVILGGVGLMLRGRSSAGARLLAAYALFYTAGLFVVIPNRRLFIQLIPPLAIFAGLAVDAAGGWLCRRASAPPSV